MVMVAAGSPIGGDRENRGPARHRAEEFAKAHPDADVPGVTRRHTPDRVWVVAPLISPPLLRLPTPCRRSVATGGSSASAHRWRQLKLRGPASDPRFRPGVRPG